MGMMQCNSCGLLVLPYILQSLEGEVAVDDTKFRILLPSLLCSVYDLPDSDGKNQSIIRIAPLIKTP